MIKVFFRFLVFYEMFHLGLIGVDYWALMGLVYAGLMTAGARWAKVI